jgi:glycosyltransferase involved in cell wall biosynthesis
VDKLSVIIITLNEERNIERALKSVSQLADEIIVLDSFSTDKTEELCKQFDVRFVKEKWKGYAATKNFANDLATYDWILSLDADESVDEIMAGDINSYKAKGFEGVYVLNRLTNYCGSWIKHSTWYPDKKVRIFNKQNTRWVGEYVHEELEFTQSVKETLVKGHLNHYSYYNYKEHRERADRYSVLTAQKMNAAGKKAGVLKPYLSAIARFFSMYVIHIGFLDGKAGFKIAQISAQSNVVKYKTLRKLNKEND